MASLPPLNAKVTADVSGYKSGLSEAAGATSNFMQTVGAMAGGMLSAEAAIKVAEGGIDLLKEATIGAAEGIFHLAEAAGKYSESMANMSTRTQVSVEDVQKIKYASELAGVSFDGVSHSVEIMSRKLAEGDDIFKRLGLSAKALQAEGGMKAAADIMDAIANLKDPMARTAAEMEAFGRGGAASIAPLIGNFRDLAGEAGHFGTVLSSEAIEASAKMDDELDRIGTAMGKVQIEFGAAIAQSPELSRVFHEIAEGLASMGDWINKNQGVITALTSAVISFGETTVTVIQKILGIGEQFANSALGKVLLGQVGINVDSIKQTFAAMSEAGNATQWQTGATAKGGTGTLAPKKDAEELLKLQKERLKEEMDMSKALDNEAVSMRQLAQQQNDQALKDQYADNAHLLALEKQANAALNLHQEYKEGSEAIEESMLPAMAQMLGVSEDVLRAMLGFPAPLETAKKDVKDMEAAAAKLEKHFSQAAGVLHQMGFDSESLVGNLADAGADAMKQRADIQKSVNSGDSVEAGIGVAGAAVGIFQDAKGSGKVESKGHAAAIGAAKGAIKGAAIGSIIPGIGTAVGAIVGGVIGLVGGLMHKNPEWSKVMEDVGKGWGVNISEGLAKKIEETEKSAGVGKQMAELLNIDAIMRESGGDPGQFKDKINNLMEAVKLGAVPAGEGVKALGQAFTDLKIAADGGSVASTVAMVEMIKRAKELGETIPGMDAAIQAAVDRSIKGLKEFMDGIGATGEEGTLLSPAAGAAVAGVFDAVTVAAEAQYGIVDAVDKLGGSFDAMMKKLPEGTALGAGASDFAHIKNLMDTSPEFKGAAKGAKGLADVTGGLIESGNLTPQAMDAIGASTVALYHQAKGATGATDLDALKAIAPELKEIQKAQALGMKLTPEEAKLMADAQKAGILPLEDIQTQQLKVQQDIRAGIGKLNGDATTTPGAPPGSHHAAEGFFSPNMPGGPLRGGGTGLVVHPGEQVRVTPAGMKSGGWGSSMTTNLSVNLGTLVGDPGVLGDMLKQLVDQGHEGAMSAIQQASWKG